MVKTSKPKVLFVYDHRYPELWKDGLWAALELLEGYCEVSTLNLFDDIFTGTKHDNFDFTLGWGAFGSRVDNYLQQGSAYPTFKTGLCIAGNAVPPEGEDFYDVLFYETQWYRPQIQHHRNIVHAFGVNTDIYFPTESVKVFDTLSVGAFALWKRQDKLINSGGITMVIGEIQEDNWVESAGIMERLLKGGCAVSGMVRPYELARFYNASKLVHIPADINGGGERAVLEARACEVDVKVENDNPKLKELMYSPLYDQHYYCDKLWEGILSTLN